MCLLTQGCYFLSLPVTYPSPHPTGGDNIVYPFARVDKDYLLQAKGLSEFERRCTYPEDERYGTRTRAGFTVEAVGFCFFSPYSGDPAVQHVEENVDLVPWRRCSSRFGLYRREPISFEVRVAGKDIAFDHPAGKLAVAGRSATAQADVQGADYPGGPKPKGWYQVLTFHFDEPCDPEARYRLTITGVTSQGRAIRVPPVDFDPLTEWRPARVD